MVISELEAKLKALREEHGDLPVYADYDVDGVEVYKSGIVEPYIYIRGVRSNESNRIDNQ